MFNSEDEERMYREAAREEKKLQESITREEAKDIAYMFIYLITTEYIDEPYLTDIKNRFLRLLKLESNDVAGNPNIEEVRLRLAATYNFYHKIPAICGFCCLGIDKFAPIFQKFVYQKEYDNLLKYNK